MWNDQRRIAIVGSGGFAREVFQLIRDLQQSGEAISVSGFVSRDAPDAKLMRRLNSRWLGDDSAFLTNAVGDFYVLAVADPTVRQYLSSLYARSDLSAVDLRHPSALVGSNVVFGEGYILGAYAQLTTDIQCGEQLQVDRGAMIGHDCEIGSFVTLHPGSIISGGVSIGSRARIGAGACVLPDISIGADSVVGAGAVVTKNIPVGGRYAGIPARPLSQKSQ